MMLSATKASSSLPTTSGVLSTAGTHAASSTSTDFLQVPKYKPLPIDDSPVEFRYGTDGNDTLRGNGGYEYTSGGNGNDYLYATDNNGTWRGSGNEMGKATILDGGNGNDIMQVWADRGAFMIDTGAGDDHVKISNDATYVKIQNYDGTDAGDTFEFGNDFSGTAEIYSFDHNDTLHFNGVYAESSVSDWDRSYDPASHDTTFHNPDTGGTIIIRAEEVKWSDVTFQDGPTAQFPYGYWGGFVEWT